MPCRLRIKIYEARDLPFRKAALWDAYVEVKFDGMSEKTDVVRQSINPVWNKAIRWDVPDDKSLQDSPLEILIWDHDSVSNNIMGSVFIDLNCLLNNNETNPHISGWFPIFDTLRGFRGDIKIKVRLEFFRDANAFAPSSTEVMFFSISAPLALYNIDAMYGFAEELIVEDDPEYHWTDQFRASRISNAERAYLLYRLAGRLRRQIGKKVRDVGGNAVLAYAQHFDMIEKSIVARGYGTMCRLSRAVPVAPPSSPDTTAEKIAKTRRHAKRLVSPPPASQPPSLKASTRDSEGDSSSEDARKEKRLNLLKSSSSRRSLDEGGVSSSPRGRSNLRSKENTTTDESDSSSEKERNKKESSRRRRRKEKAAAKDESSSSSSSSSSSPERKDKSRSKSGTLSSPSEESSSSSSSSEQRERKLKKEKKRKKERKDKKSASATNVTSPLKTEEEAKDKEKEAGKVDKRRASRDDDKKSPKEDEERDKKKEKEKEKERVRSKDDESSGSEDGSATDSSFSADLRPRRDSKIEDGGRPILAASAGSPRKDSTALEELVLGTTPEAGKAVAWLPKDVQLLTVDTFPPDVRMRIGSIVAAHSVKLAKSAEHVEENTDSWWLEVREEVKSHAQALSCSYVAGYSETTTILGDLLVLSGVGTAVNLHFPPAERRADADDPISRVSSGPLSLPSPVKKPTKRRRKCSFCHIPYSQANPPFQMQLVLCLICKKKYVPEVLMSTCEPPTDLPITGVGRLLEARVCRPKKSTDKGEATATAISDAVPFLQYDLHQQIMYKLKVHGLNAVFGLRFQITVGESMLIAVASGTAVFLPALPPPPLLHLANIDSSKKKSKELSQLQQKIMKVSETSREQLSNALSVVHPDITGSEAVTPTSVEEFKPAAEVSIPDKKGDAAEKKEEVPRTSTSGTAAPSVTPFVVEVEDEIDADSMAVLLDPDLPEGFWLCSTDTLPGSMLLPKANLQMVTAIRRVEWDVKDKQLNQNFSALFHSLFTSLLFKFRDVTPVCICSLRVDIQIPDEESVELIMNGVAVLLQQPPNSKKLIKKASTRELSKSEDDHMQFAMEVDPKKSEASIPLTLSLSASVSLPTSTSEHELRRLRAIIELTPSSFIPGARIEKYLGRVNLHLIKERMSFNKDTKEEAGTVEDDLGLFTHELITEAQALLRANVAALGGNALICYRIEELRVNENTDSNSRGYCLISVSGDALIVRPMDHHHHHHHHHRSKHSVEKP